MEQWQERSPPTNLVQVRFLLGAISGLSLFLVFALLKGFFSRFPQFSTPKTNISKFQFDHDRGAALKPAKADVASSLNIIIYFIISLFIDLLID